MKRQCILEGTSTVQKSLGASTGVTKPHCLGKGDKLLKTPPLHYELIPVACLLCSSLPLQLGFEAATHPVEKRERLGSLEESFI